MISIRFLHRIVKTHAKLKSIMGSFVERSGRKESGGVVNSNTKAFLTSGTGLILSAVLVGTTWGDTLSSTKQQLAQKQQQAQQIQAQADQTSKQIDQQKHKTQVLQQSLQQTQTTLAQTKQQMSTNSQEQQQLQNKIDSLTKNIEVTQTQLAKDTVAVNNMLRASYEYGSIPYVDVIFQSTSFSDLLSRLNLLSMVTKSERQLVQHLANLQDSLKKQRTQQDAAIHELQLKATQLYQMKLTEVSLQKQKQNSIALVSRNVNILQQQEAKYSQEMHLTQQQITDLKQQIAEQEAIMATKSGNIVESNLRYIPVSAQKLYDFVQQYDVRWYGSHSAFSVSDMQTIIQAGKNYNVNPILLVAITGQEQAFDPLSWGAAQQIRKNPFNVYYSWQWTEMNRPSWTLVDTANIAANTVRHKLSTPPEYGDNVFTWLNDPRNPWGLYATDRHWSAGVQKFFYAISSYVNS